MNERLSVTCPVCQANILLEQLDPADWKSLGPVIPGNCIVLHSLLINQTPLKGILCPNLENAKRRTIAEFQDQSEFDDGERKHAGGV